MKLARADTAMGAIMAASLAVLLAMAPFSHIYEGSEALFSLPPAIFFAIPLSQACLQGIAAAREGIGSYSGESARTRFRRVLKTRIPVWTALWSIYLVAWECISYRAAGFRFDFPVTVLGSASRLVVISLLTSSCLVWAHPMQEDVDIGVAHFVVLASWVTILRPYRFSLWCRGETSVRFWAECHYWAQVRVIGSILTARAFEEHNHVPCTRMPASGWTSTQMVLGTKTPSS